MLVPSQRLAAPGPAQQVLHVPGGSAALREALQDAERAGWDAWAVASEGVRGWRLTLVQRDERA